VQFLKRLAELDHQKLCEGDIFHILTVQVIRKRDFPRTLTPAVLMDCPSNRAIPGRSGSGGFVEVEGQQVGNIGVAGALRQFSEDVAQPR